MLSISNLLSIFRIFLIIPIAILLNRGNGEEYTLVFFLILIAALADYLDGYFARKFKQVSELGKVLDPLADKLLICVMAILLVIRRDFPLWYASLIIGRDLIIGFLGSYIIRKRKFTAQSNIMGKITANVILSSAAVYVIDWDFMKLPIVYIGAFLILLSLISYGSLFIKLLKTQTEENNI